jgi:phosphoadenosine phosphosulfate reductase
VSQVAEGTGQRVRLDDYEVGELAVLFDDKPPEEILAWAIERFGRRLAICSSMQAESLVLFDMAWRIDPKVRIFTIDTGRLPPETYELIDRIRDKYGVEVEVEFPDAAQLSRMTTRYGVNLFYQSVPKRLLCCEVRKVEPLRRKLAELDAWVTGLRREHWPTRANIRKIDIDHDHDGIVKLNPLADWIHEDVWQYIREHDVPYNRLYDQGYTSISCACCTRPTKPGEDPRAGRWWWEQGAPKECGMHCSIETGGFEHELEALLDDVVRGRARGEARA